MKPLSTVITFGLLAVVTQSGCAALWAGAGAAGAATAYEAHNRHELKELEEDYKEGRISSEQYGKQKDQIEDRSVVY